MTAHVSPYEFRCACTPPRRTDSAASSSSWVSPATSLRRLRFSQQLVGGSPALRLAVQRVRRISAQSGRLATLHNPAPEGNAEIGANG